MNDTDTFASDSTVAETAQQEPLITVRDLAVRYGDREVLQHISFDVYRGENLVILGGSGGGKSTLLHLLAGLDRPDSESRRFDEAVRRADRN